ncbi:MAG TPA: hypothetical protein PL070_14155, partial [Flavobacteriales bacterium]|nr:hypothetical protein [Flavobacteriales bacterium]
MQLIGVHGPQRGVLIPGFGDFFPYQPGDIVETHLYQMSGNNSASQQFTYRKHEILERIEVSPEHLIFNTRFFSRVENYTGQYTMFGYGLETWDMDPADVLQSPLHSSPNELIELGGHLWSNWNNLVPVMQMVASHYRDSLGHYVIESKPGEWGTLFSIEGAPDTMGCVDLLDDISTVGGGYRLDDLLGVRLRLFVNLPYRRSFSTEGAVLGGDTIGTVHDDLFFHVGIDESVSRRSILSPTVASDNVILTLDPPQPTTWSIRS